MAYTKYEPIGFENGTLVSKGYVDLKTGEFTEPIYSGKAPVNATNLDHLEQGLVQLETFALASEKIIKNNETNCEKLKSDLQSLDSQINGLASGSPLAASSINEMIDITRIYVNTSDGYWYYYNGTTWTSGGLYQASNYDELELLINTKMDAEFEKDSNIESSIITYNLNKRFLASGIAEETTGDVWAVSDYINLDEGIVATGYSFQGRCAIVEYDEDKNITGLINGDGSESRPKAFTKTYYGSTFKCKYIRIQSCLGYSNTASAYKLKQIQLQDLISIKKEYQDGIIHFTVDVNTNIATESNENVNNDSETINTMQCVLQLPTTYNRTETPTKLVVFCHGAGGVVNSTSGGEIINADVLLNNGYAVMDCAGVVGENTTAGSCEHLGNPLAIQGYMKAIKYVMNNYNVEDKIYLHGHSMGGLMALNLANACPEYVKVLSLFFPVTDLYNQAWLNPWHKGGTTGSTRMKLAEYYNFTDTTGQTYEEEKVKGYNPINNKSMVIDDNRYNSLPVPIKIWHGDSDTAVSLEGSQKLVEALKNYGCQATLRIVNGLGHQWNDVIKNEELYWLNRF